MRRSHTVTAAFAVLALGAGVLVAGCASRAFIGQVKTNPGRYIDRSVTVSGIVTNSWGMPFVPLQLYQVDDGTGELLVVSDGQRPPSRGAQVRVTGRVEEFAVVGGRSVGLHLRARDLDYR